MLFVTNRVFKNGYFDLNDTNALQSFYCCERIKENSFVEIGSQSFFQRLKNSSSKEILIYIHGFNEIPENHIFPWAETLQKLFDEFESNLVEVVCAIYPCKSVSGISLIKGYYHDGNAADASNVAFARVLAKLQDWQMQESIPCKKKINVLAHSMGNRVLRGAIKWWSEEIIGHEPPLLFNNLFMVAPDLENQTLEVGKEGYYLPLSSKCVKIFHSYEDIALRASKVANSSFSKGTSRRLGHTGPYDINKVSKNVFSINCDQIAQLYDPLRGHIYFMEDHNNLPGRCFTNIANGIKNPSLSSTKQYSLGDYP